MGKRLYVAKKYEVEWSDNAHFNWKQTEFHELMDALEMSYSGESWDDEFDVLKESWKQGIDTLKNYDRLDNGIQASIDECLEKLEYSREELIGILEGYYSEAAPDNDYIKCSFW